MTTGIANNIRKHLGRPVHIAPLAVFRILFGLMMLASVIRFMLKGWVTDLYITPKFYFTYYGFEWVKPLGATGMYLLFVLMAIAALGMMLGLFYRLSATLFFLSFTYVELIDKTNYLNHYYFVSIIAFLMILLPAGKAYSLDAKRNPGIAVTHIPLWCIGIIQFQLGMVYFFAGVAKLNSDWLLNAQPLRIWLQPHTNLPVIGPWMDKEWVAYIFSWCGALYDLLIPFLLLNRRTRLMAYGTVIIFHVLTAILFPIGMFPYIMIICTLIFFDTKFHRSVLQIFESKRKSESFTKEKALIFAPLVTKVLTIVLVTHFTIQLLMPFRYLLYPGHLFWTEQGYRFSWRVMLMEKAGKVFFHVKDPDTQRSGEAVIPDELTPNQEKMMATQPDMILQYAHHLSDYYKTRGIKNPEITAECYVTLNGRGSKLFIDPTVDLTQQTESFYHKNWILPFQP